MRKACWIWYPGDYEMFLFGKTMVQRYERDVPALPFWRMDSFYTSVKFKSSFTLKNDDVITIKAAGIFSVQVDSDQYVYNFKDSISLSKGEHNITISVYCTEKMPCIFVSGKELVSDDTWLTSCNDGKWINAARGEFCSSDFSPNDFKLSVTEVFPVSDKVIAGKRILDFGKEMICFITAIDAQTSFTLHYGESESEALSFSSCELTNEFSSGTSTTQIAKAFRYFAVDESVKCKFKVMYEYLPLDRRASFYCDDDKINQIYEMSYYTFHLNSREFFLDGIKRDRWVWGGDAYQSYLMNFYSFFDLDLCKRTMLALIGKPPYTMHINHIMDYTFYWIMGFYDYYFFTKDEKFIKDNFEKAKGLLDFAISRTNKSGLMEGLSNDWVFVDWAKIDNRGEVALEQMLFYISLKSMAELSLTVGEKETAKNYFEKAENVHQQLDKFWDDDLGAYVHSFKDGVSDKTVTRHANMFALLYDLCGEKRKNSIKKNVLLNDKVDALLTPYMRFYELSALCEVGEFDYVFEELNSYWGGMISEGATSFWEQYNPKDVGDARYAMYGRPFGKSLCHAWGASPLYLIGKYFIGLTPAEAGYESFNLCPKLKYFKSLEVTLPTNIGEVKIVFNDNVLTVHSSNASGNLHLNGKIYAITPQEKLIIKDAYLK